MKKQDALNHFGSAKKVAEAAKVTRAAVYQWGELVPVVPALRLAEASGGALQVDLPTYTDKAKPGATASVEAQGVDANGSPAV